MKIPIISLPLLLLLNISNIANFPKQTIHHMLFRQPLFSLITSFIRGYSHFPLRALASTSNTPSASAGLELKELLHKPSWHTRGILILASVIISRCMDNPFFTTERSQRTLSTFAAIWLVLTSESCIQVSLTGYCSSVCACPAVIHRRHVVFWINLAYSGVCVLFIH